MIKKQRKELDISLEALSHGVCSPSYLSKIENNILVANDDIYNLLFKKLGISTMDTIKEEKIKQMLDLFFKYYMSSDSKIFKVMDELSTLAGVELPKGGGKTATECAKHILLQYGEEKLAKLVKMHFANYKVLFNQDTL